LRNLELNVGLEDGQREPAARGLAALDRALRRHYRERLGYSRAVYLLQRRIDAMGRRFERVLDRQSAEAERRWSAVRAGLRPAQRRTFDLLMAERRRLEREASRRKEAAARHRPPDGRSF
ncbi:MAG: hypothetical protein KGL53_07715, partial [Elusimicrobia bacterium]|nr:hypothetical protein [Elusimicrobiota bacterium]